MEKKEKKAGFERLLEGVFILAFALSFALPFAGIEGRRIEALVKDNPRLFLGNDGLRTTSFGLHVLPHYIFSEDYHLYYLRTARSLRFGFPDNIFEPSASEGRDFRNLVQTAAAALPALFGGNLKVYAAIYFLYIALGIWITSLAAKVFVRDRLTSLVLACAFLMSAGPRYLRMSTHTLALPVLMLGISFLFEALRSFHAGRHRDFHPWGRVLIVLAALSLWDMWSFLTLLSLSGAAVLGTFLSLPGPLRRWKEPQPRRQAFAFLLIGGGSLLFVLAVHRLIAGPVPADLLERAGFLSPSLPGAEYLKPGELLFRALGSFLVLAAVRGFRHLTVKFFVFFSASAVLLTAAAVFILRAESYQLFHFEFLFSRLALWLMLTGVFYAGRPVLLDRLKKFRGRVPAAVSDAAARITLPLKAAILLVLLVTAASSFATIFRHQYREYGNPRVYEKLLHYIETNVPESRGRSLLTLSHELNHLLAYHTDFDLLLPEGFPLHSRLTHQAIMDRMGEISRFLDISIHGWSVFLEPYHAVDQISWRANRLISERHGYLYYLFHRYSMREEWIKEGKQAAVLEQDLLKHIFVYARTFREKPDYLLSEDVFRFLRAKVPADYEQVFASGNIVLYKLKEER